MANPRIESIATDLETAVNAINVANGFNQDLTAVRPRRNDFNDIVPENGKVLIWQGDEEPVDEHAYNVQTWKQEFALMAIVLDDDTAQTSIDTRINQVRGDIEKKLMVDVTRGGIAFDTHLAGSGKFDNGEGFSGIAVIIAVDYRVSRSDPYSAA